MKPYRVALSAVTLFVLFTLAVLPAFAAPLQTKENGATSRASIPHLQARLLTIINKERKTKGAKPLALNAKLTACATAHSVAMQKANRLFHNVAKDVCISHNYSGENIGRGVGKPLAALKSLNKQMWSEGPCPVKLLAGLVCTPFGSAADFALWEKHSHYLNLICKLYTSIGIGIDVYKGSTWLTLDFAGTYHSGDPRSTFCTNSKNGA